MPVAIPVRSRSVASLACDMELRRILRVQSSSAWLWCARLLWVVLPVSCGAAFADALDGWSSEPAAIAAALLWIAWAGGLLALFAPRPWGLTLLRVVAPLAVVSAAATFFGAGGGVSLLAVGTTFIAAVFALSAPVNEAAGNALAYGDEVRVPLRIPTPLLLGPIPLGLLLLGSVIATRARSHSPTAAFRSASSRSSSGCRVASPGCARCTCWRSVGSSSYRPASRSSTR